VDGSIFKEKKIARYRSTGKESVEITEVQNKAGERSVIIALSGYPMMKLRGSAPDETREFFLLSQEYLGGGVNSWNEYTLDLAGTGSLSLGETAALQIAGEIEPVQISKGRIQRYDTRITGSEALSNLRNRRERVLALVEWMKEREDTPRIENMGEFDNYWKPLLLPEMVSKKNRPEGWMLEGDVSVKNEDVRWNTSYTERLFPEHLRPVRDSGTLLRDWEDALSWIYLEYEWESIVEFFSHEIILERVK
ncbi:MAG: hypothetical protein LBG91_02560, partial [Treponema sp.]|nr:hypothetical protein [Treponema sp.]